MGNPSFQRKADIAQRKSILLLQNNMNLPMAIPENDTMILFTIGMDTDMFHHRSWAGFKVFTRNLDSSRDELILSIPNEIDYAIMHIHVANVRGHSRMFGSANSDELSMLSFSGMARANSWKITPSLKIFRLY